MNIPGSKLATGDHWNHRIMRGELQGFSSSIRIYVPDCPLKIARSQYPPLACLEHVCGQQARVGQKQFKQDLERLYKDLIKPFEDSYYKDVLRPWRCKRPG